MKIFDFHIHPGYDFGREAMPSEQFVKELQAKGIAKCAGSVIREKYYKRDTADYEGIVPALNEEAYRFYEEYPDFYVPGIHVHPFFPEMSCREIEAYAAKGVKLIGELTPYLMGWRSYADKRLYEILELAAHYDMVVSIHPDGPSEMKQLLENVPQAKIVIAHIDAYGLYEDEIAMMKAHENVCCDLSAHGADREGMIRQTIDSVGVERVLFGSDFPGCQPETFLEPLGRTDITDAERQAILWDNAARLLRVE